MLMPLSVLGVKPKGVLHIGGCAGEEALIYKEANVDRVVWFECNPRILHYLHLAVDSIPGHCVIEAAVSDVDGERVTFNITNNDASSSLLNLKEHKAYYPEIKVDRQIEVVTRRVDSILPEYNFYYNQFDFANLDIQGAELKALRGMTECLKHLRWVYTEVNTQELYEGCALLHEIDDFLKEHGFHQQRIALTHAGWGDAFYVRK
jgi:FkbM family methyltransferase